MEFESIDSFLNYSIFSRNKLSYESKRIFEKYYQKYCKNFNKYERHHYKRQSQEITKIIQRKNQPKVLEIGCGCGTESLWFSLLGADVTGIDISKNRLKVANERKILIKKDFKIQMHIKFYDYDFFNFCKKESKESFDIIWMEQAYHHIEPRNELIKNLKKILKKDGFLVISETNGWNPFIQMLLFFKRGFNTIIYEKNGEKQLYGNERITTKNKLKTDLINNQFSIIESSLFRVFPNYKFLKSFYFIEKIIPKTFLFFLFTHFNIVAKLKSKVN